MQENTRTIGANRIDTPGETSAEEAAAYLSEEYERDRLNAPNTVKAWVESFFARIRAWLHSKGVMGAERLTEADISAIARANLKQMAASPFKTGSDPEEFRGKKSGGTGFYVSLARRALGVKALCSSR